MADPIEIAAREIAELEAKAREIEARKEKVAQFLDLAQELGFVQSTPKPVQRTLMDGQGDAVHSEAPRPLRMPDYFRVQIPAPVILANVGASGRRGRQHPVAEVSAELIANSPTGHIRTQDLVPLLEEGGVKVGGKSPLAGVSAVLSKDERFTPNRKLGWALKKETPTSVAADVGVDSQQADGLPKPEGTEPGGGN